MKMENWSKLGYAAVAFLFIGFLSVLGTNETKNITATLGSFKNRNISIVLLRDTFEGANHLCQSKGLGPLMWDKTQHGYELIALRHWILSSYGSLFNETFWIGYIKRTIDWYRISNCRTFNWKCPVSNQTDGQQQCTTLNMTKDETSNMYLLYATTCQESSFFVCAINTAPLGYEEFNQTIIDPIPSHSWWKTVQDFGNNTCFHENLVRWYLAWAVQEWHDTNTCVYYVAKSMVYSVEVQVRKTTLNTTLRVKTAITNYNVIKPSSTIRPINSVTCSDPAVPSTEMASSSLVCQSSETQFCNCGSSLTSEELDVKVENLKTENKVSKSSLSSYTRTKSSASDSRPSSATMGVLGIVLITGVCVLIVSSDISRLIQALIRLHRKTRNRL